METEGPAAPRSSPCTLALHYALLEAFQVEQLQEGRARWQRARAVEVGVKDPVAAWRKVDVIDLAGSDLRVRYTLERSIPLPALEDADQGAGVGGILRRCA